MIQLGFLLGLAQHQCPPVLRAQIPQLSCSMPVNVSSQIQQAVGCEAEGSLETCQNFPKAVESSRFVEDSTLPPTNPERWECAHKLFQALCQHPGWISGRAPHFSPRQVGNPQPLQQVSHLPATLGQDWGCVSV